METKLKALKVVDLKAILAKAAVSTPAKATKSDLISRIQASKSALETYAALYPQDDLLAPPEEVDWNVDQDETSGPPKGVEPEPEPPAATSKSTPSSLPKFAFVPPPTTGSMQATSQEFSEADIELEKRRQRASRFGIPLVEHQQPKKPIEVPTAPKVGPAATTKAFPPPKLDTDPTKLAERAARFGIDLQKTTSPTNGKKRSATQTPEIDPEEQERRRKRAERFGATNKA